MSEYYDIGTATQEVNDDVIVKIYEACLAHPDFQFIEFRRVENDNYAVLVDCCNSDVPNRNSIGIKNRERLALVHYPKKKMPFEIRALRKDFPITLHQNYVSQGEPASLCLYQESWKTLERKWTPQLHLQRILWWLSETSRRNLHQEDQPLEHLFFESSTEMILPVDFEKRLNGDEIPKLSILLIRKSNNHTIYAGVFEKQESQNDREFDCVVITISPITHPPITLFPNSLGGLYDYFNYYQVNLVDILKKELQRITPTEGIENKDKDTIIIVRIPVRRHDDRQPEETQTIGFVIDSSLAKLGESLGVLIRDPASGKYYYDHLQNGTGQEWKGIRIELLKFIKSITHKLARQLSGISNETARFNGILAGVGALGSCLADIWSKESWGCWTYIDDDCIYPHNLVRHLSRIESLGEPKVNATKRMTDHNYWPGYISTDIIFGRIDSVNPEILEKYKNVNLIVDVTTTLEVPRDLANSDNTPRSTSVFITPSGLSSVILLEDKGRSIRLDGLEAQYYRAIINEEWGKDHLNSHSSLRIGTGCRDLSMVISQELIALHAATIARQLRLKVEKPDPAMIIWELDDSTGSLKTHIVPVYECKESVVGEWKVKWDDGFEEKVQLYRRTNLPKETGGIVVGYIDQKMKTIMLVDTLEAPVDSESTPTSFIRGTSGLKEFLKNVSDRTANIVEYLGEWHSHPRNFTTYPSGLDLTLLLYLTQNMKEEGKPGLIIIVGDDDFRICVGNAFLN